MSGKAIKLDADEVLKKYDAACITCPQCGRKMIPLDWEDYCSYCKISIKRDDYHDLEESKP